MAIHKMFIVDLEKPMIFFVLFQQPVTSVDIFLLLQGTTPLSLLLGDGTLHFQLVLLIETKNCFFVVVSDGVVFRERTQRHRVMKVEDLLDRKSVV